MKPIERAGYIDFWILLQQNSSGMFNQVTTSPTTYGNGFYVTEKDAQHAQTIELLKGNKTQVYHLEWPLT